MSRQHELRVGMVVTSPRVGGGEIRGVVIGAEDTPYTFECYCGCGSQVVVRWQFKPEPHDMGWLPHDLDLADPTSQLGALSDE